MCTTIISNIVIMIITAHLITSIKRQESLQRRVRKINAISTLRGRQQIRARELATESGLCISTLR